MHFSSATRAFPEPLRWWNHGISVLWPRKTIIQTNKYVSVSWNGNFINLVLQYSNSNHAVNLNGCVTQSERITYKLHTVYKSFWSTLEETIRSLTVIPGAWRLLAHLRTFGFGVFSVHSKWNLIWKFKTRFLSRFCVRPKAMRFPFLGSTKDLFEKAKNIVTIKNPITDVSPFLIGMQDLFGKRFYWAFIF